MITDTHCHIYSTYYEDINTVIKNAEKNKVNRFINTACDVETSKEVLSLTELFENMYGAVGIHPQSVSEYNQENLSFLEDLLKHKKIIAIGEIGLDYYWVKDNKQEQKDLFEAQLKLAEKYNLPIIVHNREATNDILMILKKYKLKGVIHSFTGSYETAMQFIQMGYLLGINGVVTFENSNFSKVVKQLPLDKLIIETDSPYLTPHPCRGKKNEPANAKIIVEYLAKLLHINELEIANITNKNVKSIFDI